MPNSCISCKGSKVSMFQFPSDKVKREQWLEALCLREDDITESSCICSRYFFSGDSSNLMPYSLHYYLATDDDSLSNY